MIGRIFLALMLFLPVTAEADLRTEKLRVNTAVGQQEFVVEIADSDHSRTQGLMFRKSLASGRGMLFVFPDNLPRRFWMKNTVIPLDMIFINADRKIAKIHAMAKPYDLTGISSVVPVIAVLEINGGEAARRGFSPGDKIDARVLSQAVAKP
jgi:uncharacterized protein